MTKEKLTQRNEQTGVIEWTKYADELSRESPTYIGALARQLIFEYEKGGAGNELLERKTR